MEKEKWNPNDYQGKRKDQVKSSYYGCFVSGIILLLIIGIAIVQQFL